MSAAPPDARGRRVAVVADALLPELLDRLEADGFGVIQLPPAGLDAATRALWLEQVREHVDEFARGGYEVVLADDGGWAAEFPELRQYAIQPPSTSRLTPET